MEAQLSLEFLRVVENGAIAAARTMGFGDRHHADEVAVEAMRKTMDAVEMDGTIVIGEGERDEAPMLFIGEKVGLATHAPKALFPLVDIAVDPLEGTNLCATGAANAISVLAASTAMAFGAPVAQRFVPSRGSTAISTEGKRDLGACWARPTFSPM